MELDEAKKKQVAQWIDEGLKLAEVQKRLDAEFGLRLTYMETRLLMDDLKLVPKTQVEPAPSPAQNIPTGAADPTPPKPGPGVDGQVRVHVDQVARPGAVISGQVSFSDGQRATWSLDQFGRLGLSTDQPGYKPSAEDLSEFQASLQEQLQKLGF